MTLSSDARPVFHMTPVSRSDAFLDRVMTALVVEGEDMEATASQIGHALGADEDDVTDALRDLRDNRNRVDVVGDLGGELLWGVFR